MQTKNNGAQAQSSRDFLESRIAEAAGSWVHEATGRNISIKADHKTTAGDYSQELEACSVGRR
jgi:hypothetical protein